MEWGESPSVAMTICNREQPFQRDDFTFVDVFRLSATLDRQVLDVDIVILEILKNIQGDGRPRGRKLMDGPAFRQKIGHERGMLVSQVHPVVPLHSPIKRDLKRTRLADQS